ncbi:MAG: hypothetical protein KGD68_13535 [Candidatus Lokiarchaeota archaeon]|nr:hypothetical protein [Candidatus Lokiarchaeota archaeon]
MSDLWSLIEIVLAFIILTPFIIFNIAIAFGSFFQKKVSLFLVKKLKLEEEYKNSYLKLFNIINFIVWITVGLINILNLDNPISISSVVIFLAFRSGTTLSKRVTLGIHDLKVMKSRFSEKKYIKNVSRMVKISIIIELTFLLVWALLNRTLNVAVKSNFGIDVNILAIILWIAGIIYGFVFSLIISIPSKQFLLKNEIGIAFLLSGEIFEDKIKNKVPIPKFFKKWADSKREIR